MLGKKVFIALFCFSVGSLVAFPGFSVDISEEIKQNENLIGQYQMKIDELKQRNQFLKDELAKNPKMFEKKALYEETKEAYIHRVKLNGAEAKNVNLTIKNHRLSIEMNMKQEKEENGTYSATSQYFFQSYSIASDVDETKIEQKVEGDYFTIVMPKK